MGGEISSACSAVGAGFHGTVAAVCFGQVRALNDRAARHAADAAKQLRDSYSGRLLRGRYEEAQACARNGFCHTTSVSDLQPGDHIYSYRVAQAYQHHGIVVETNGCSAPDCQHRDACVLVVHFTPTRSDDAKGDSAEVVLSSLHAFCGTATFDLVEYDSTLVNKVICKAGTCVLEKAGPRHRTVLRALSLVGWGRGKYDLTWRNCETVSRWCKLGDDYLPDPRVSGWQCGQNYWTRGLTAIPAAVGIGALTLLAPQVLLDGGASSPARTSRSLGQVLGRSLVLVGTIHRSKETTLARQFGDDAGAAAAARLLARALPRLYRKERDVEALRAALEENFAPSPPIASPPP